jgi:hypothetical protein
MYTCLFLQEMMKCPCRAEDNKPKLFLYLRPSNHSCYDGKIRQERALEKDRER